MFLSEQDMAVLMTVLLVIRVAVTKKGNELRLHDLVLVTLY